MTGRQAGAWGNLFEDDERGFFTKERQILRRLKEMEQIKKDPIEVAVGATDTQKLAAIVTRFKELGWLKEI